MTAQRLEKITPHLWFVKEAEQAAQLYASIFPDSRVDRMTVLPSDSPSSVKRVEFTLFGPSFLDSCGDGCPRCRTPPRRGLERPGVIPLRDAGDMEDETSDPRRWKKSGWIAHVIKNENDEGWAVSMTRVGDAEPVLVSPWTMGRDKVNPKPLDHSGFATLLKGAMDVLRRHEDALRARLHRSITCTSETGQRLRADLDIQTDEDDPHAILSVVDERTEEPVRRGRASPSFKLSEKTVQRFLRTGDA